MAVFSQTGGTNGGSYAKYFTGRLTVTEQSYSVETNSSVVYYLLELVSGSSGRFSDYWADYSVTINGSVVSSGGKYYASQSYNTAYTIASGTTTVYHNDDGSKSISCSAVLDFNSGTYSPGDFNLSGTLALTTIPRASTITLSSASNLGDSLTITIDRKSSSFTHNLYYSFNSSSDTSIATGVGTSKSWTIPKSLANSIPNNTSGTLTITCKTYNGSTLVGTKTASKTVNVPDTAEFKPTVSSVTLAEAVAAIKSGYGVYIQNKSKITCTIAAAGAYSSTIKSYSTSANGVTYNASSFTTNFLTTSGSNTVSVTVTDSRGRTATGSATYTVHAYEGVKITGMSVNRCAQNGTLNDEGEYVKVEVSATIPRIVVSSTDKNTFTYNIKYRDTDVTTYTSHSSSGLTKTNTSSTIATISGSWIIAANGDNSFEYVFTVDDALSDAVTASRTIETVFQLINYNASGKGIAFGKVSEGDIFDVNMPTTLRKAVTISGATTFSNTVNFGGSTQIKSNGQFIYTPIAVPENANLNDYKTVGEYICKLNATAQTMTNCPTSKAFSLTVTMHAGVHQRLVTYDENAWAVYERNFYNSTWGTWRTLYPKPVGSILITGNDANPSTYLGGTWSCVKTYTGGELLAYGIVSATGSSSYTTVSSKTAFSSSAIPNKEYTVDNFVPGILTGKSGAIWVEPQGLVGMVEATMKISGLSGSGMRGFWFHNNSNDLPSGVTWLANDPLLTACCGESYGGMLNTWIYKVTSSATGFYVNPTFSPYNGNFTPCSGGTTCALEVKAYARAGTCYMWKRTA